MQLNEGERPNGAPFDNAVSSASSTIAADAIGSAYPSARRSAWGPDSRLALGLGEAAALFHKRIMMGKEGAELVRPVGQRQDYVRDEAGLLLHRAQAGADVFRQFVD